jgi:hypothetical protein
MKHGRDNLPLLLMPVLDNEGCWQLKGLDMKLIALALHGTGEEA